MNCFVLSAGRSGSMTLAKACRHMTNYTAGHETRARYVRQRLDYPENHVESDHRLTFFLGSLDRYYGDHATYVHLIRDTSATAASWAARNWPSSLMQQWLHVVLWNPPDASRREMARLMVQTVNDNIVMFCKDKTRVVTINIEHPHVQFDRLWEMLGAEGDHEAAHAELDVLHNAR